MRLSSSSEPVASVHPVGCAIANDPAAGCTWVLLFVRLPTLPRDVPRAHAQDLDLSHCSFPMAALPCLGPLPKLRTLRFNADHCTGNSSETVQSALLSMCLQVVAACLQHTDSRRASRRYASPGSLPQVIHEEYRNPPAARINPRPLQHGMPLQFPHSATCLVVSIHPQGARAVLV